MHIIHIINKKQIEVGKNLSTEEALRGGQNSFNLKKEKVIEQSNIEVYHCKQKDCPYFSYWESELAKHLEGMHPDKEMK